MTECTQRELRFRAPGRREVVARFDGGDITSDAGGLLLGEVDRRIGLLEGFAACFSDHRDPSRVEHGVAELVRQRVLALALGYEDLNDHDTLSADPLLALLVGKRDPKGRDRRREAHRGRALASSSTLNRLELARPESAGDDRYKRIELDFEAVDRLLVGTFLGSFDEAPAEIVLDLDATDDPLHGKQEGRFFHGYYGHYCYLPLYIFAGEHLLCARLRTSDIDASAGALEELERIVGQIRARWPSTRILVRADSGFCRESLMAWCEQEGLDYVLGLARNERLQAELEPWMQHARDLAETDGGSACLFTSFEWSTLSSWSRMRTVIGKAERLQGKDNPRFVVTSLVCRDSRDAERIYREVYCARGDMENRIKEQQLYMYADRTSTHWMRSNQVRLYLSSVAYVLMSALRRLALAGSELAQAQCHTLRLKLLKIGAQVRVTVRRVWLHMSEAYPLAEVFLLAWRRLRSP
jgi:Transposase DDE domain group 1